MKLVVTSMLTLDGVVQAPGGPEEDPADGFAHGGWAVPYFTDAMIEHVHRWTESLDALLLGRHTYEIFAAHWPYVGDEDPIAARFNAVPKHVASRTLETLDWHRSQLLGSDEVAAIQRLKQQPGAELQVHGSASLVQTLLRHGLVDELRLWWFPLVLGKGKRLFAGGTVPAGMQLKESSRFDTGVSVHSYELGDAPGHGSFAFDPPTEAEQRRRRKRAKPDR